MLPGNSVAEEAEARAAAARTAATGATEEVAGEAVAGEAAAAGAAEVAIPVVGALVAAGIIAGGVAKALIGDDNKTREAYTQNFVQQASQKLPNYNVVICHTQHKVAGPQVAHQHHEVGMHVGTCGYDSYCSPKGQPFIFQNQGDGGYLNWAYVGEFSRNGNTLTAASKLPTPKL
jgi:hypothetical protein